MTWLVAQNKFGTPKSIIHVSIIQWNEGVSDADKRVLDGVKDMAAKIPGMKNVWTKAIRVQPEGYHDAFVIEFRRSGRRGSLRQGSRARQMDGSVAEVPRRNYSPQVTND